MWSFVGFVEFCIKMEKKMKKKKERREKKTRAPNPISSVVVENVGGALKTCDKKKKLPRLIISFSHWVFVRWEIFVAWKPTWFAWSCVFFRGWPIRCDSFLSWINANRKSHKENAALSFPTNYIFVAKLLKTPKNPISFDNRFVVSSLFFHVRFAGSFPYHTLKTVYRRRRQRAQRI